MTQEKIDTAKVIAASLTATGITIADVNSLLTTFSIILAIGYTVWKWRKDYKK